VTAGPQTHGASVLITEPGLPRVLVTDGESCPETVFSLVLGERYECEFASGVEDARRRLAVDSFDLVLCDVHAGGSSAMGLAEDIISGDLDTAVVLIAETDDPVLAQRAFELGAYGYVFKPPRSGQLLITVMNALRRRALEIIENEHSQNLADRRQTIIDMAPIAIYAKDASGRYIVVNAKADELAGMEPGQLLGLSDEAFLAPEELEVGTESDSRVFAERASHERVDTVTIGGAAKTFKTIRFPLLGEQGEVSAVGGISVDITAEREAIRLRDELAASQLQAIEELRLSRLETIEGLAKAIELHDSPTAQHVNRMAAIAALLAAELGLHPDRVELVRAAAPMHDVGKIGTPAELLCKPGPLNAAERTEMERHTVVGHEIFAHFESELSRLAAVIALTHHERFDGSGYPHGLVGEKIPLEGRITAVADVFDALLTDRSYRAAMSTEEAVAVIEAGRGTHFDPRIVDVLLDHLQEALALRTN
jgi:PAS domain S-box-containing protein/putative nucleotidyltransferase with HDIG domain